MCACVCVWGGGWGRRWLSHSFISRHSFTNQRADELVFWLQHVTDAALVIIRGCHVIKFHQSLCRSTSLRARTTAAHPIISRGCHVIKFHQSLCRSTSWRARATAALPAITGGCHVIKFHQSLCTEINEQAGASRHYSCHVIKVHQSLCRSTSWRARATAAHPAITRGWPWTFTTMQGQRNTSASAPPWEVGARTSPTTSIASSTTSRILTAFNGSS